MTGVLIVMDILWCLTMRNVWASKPFKNGTSWAIFDYLKSFTLICSYVNIGVKVSIKYFYIKNFYRV